jgi:hypothetical protein
MNDKVITKKIPEIGELEYKIASTREELEGAMSLVYREYMMRGFILPKYYKSNLRVTLHHAHPDTATFVVLKNKQVLAAATIVPDSPLGLPMDMGYKNETDKLRKDGRKICEAGYLAIESGLFGRGLFSMFNFTKIDFMFSLFKLEMYYTLSFKQFDDICIVTNPKYMIFKFLPFEIIGKIKYYGYDRASVKKKAAVAKRLDLHRLEDKMKARIGLYKLFFGSTVPKDIFLNKYKFSREDLHYFFVEKSDIFRTLNAKDREYICSCYGLTKEDFNQMLKGKFSGRD